VQSALRIWARCSRWQRVEFFSQQIGLSPLRMTPEAIVWIFYQSIVKSREPCLELVPSKASRCVMNSRMMGRADRL
jgi:hypothetical protein